MKNRTKSTKQNITLQVKSRKTSHQTSKCLNKNKKDENQTKKYLLKTLNILQNHFNIPKIQKKLSCTQLSSNIYEIIKNNFAIENKKTIKHEQLKGQKNLRQYITNSNIILRDSTNTIDANKSTASLLNISQINAKRRSNSALDQYFKQKFGSPAVDEQTIQKRLRLIKALKKSQQIVHKANQNNQKYILISKQNKLSNSLLQQVNDKNNLIIEKMKIKKK